MYDPLALKSLIDDYEKAQRMAGHPLPRTVCRAVIIENLKPSLEKAFERVSDTMSGFELLIAQHALAHFEFMNAEVIDAEGHGQMDGNVPAVGSGGEPDIGEPQ